MKYFLHLIILAVDEELFCLSQVVLNASPVVPCPCQCSCTKTRVLYVMWGKLEGLGQVREYLTPPWARLFFGFSSFFPYNSAFYIHSRTLCFSSLGRLDLCQRFLIPLIETDFIHRHKIKGRGHFGITGDIGHVHG